MYDGTYPEPRYAKIRKQIIKEFGEEVDDGDGFINRKALGSIVFGNPEKLEKLNSLLSTAIRVKICKELYGKQGLIMLNSALLAEADMLTMVNNNVIFIHIDEKIQRKRLQERGMTDEQITRRIDSQHDYGKKGKLIMDSIKQYHHGHIFQVSGDIDNMSEHLNNLLNRIGMIKKEGKE